MAQRELPEINASSMADIAFLLLTFFLIATTLNKEEGIERTVPDPNQQTPPIELHEQNLYRILINQMGQIQINGQNSEMKDILPGVKDFVDNGGGIGEKTGEACSYCQGAHDPNSSKTPQDAVVSIEMDAATPYNYFYTVENYIDRAYFELQDRYSKDQFGIGIKELRKLAKGEGADPTNVEKYNKVIEAYPKQIAKARAR